MSDAATSLTNHPTLYIEDGNFIIKCNSTLFCMHKSRLSRSSEVFRDLCARDYKPADKLRGLPWIEVSDTEEDMEILLEIIESNPVPPVPADFAYTSSALRMTIKYRVIHKRDALLASLSATLHDLFFELTPAKRPHPAEAIALLRECDYRNPIDLAMLFYELSLRVTNHPAPLADDTMRLLEPADLERLAIGTGRLHRAHTSGARFPAGHIPHLACQPRLLRWWVEVAEPLLHADERILHGWIRLRDEVEQRGILGGATMPNGLVIQFPMQMAPCFFCREALKGHVLRTTQTLIEQLGSYFVLV
ncbi:hypothetical protein HWV62_41545 [Athelia sp. TMB]|nr:hypothetical protein HWV62_17188 [Athelia sp. TMB]KAF7986111.1 hypothetical protein HWV62_41545 [Athelia sp. TMB]